MSGDPFSTMGVEARFDLDPKMLAERHRDLSRALHPDRYSSAPAAERRMALGRAIEVNEAYRLLRDPVKRAEAVARHLGLAVGETTEPKPPASLLMEMMDAREELAEATRAKEIHRVTALGDTMRERESDVTRRMAAAFSTAASVPASADDRDKVLPLLGELRYVRRFLEEVAAFEETLLS